MAQDLQVAILSLEIILPRLVVAVAAEILILVADYLEDRVAVMPILFTPPYLLGVLDTGILLRHSKVILEVEEIIDQMALKDQGAVAGEPVGQAQTDILQVAPVA